jgi:prolipoprotein diacylglyceryltransferase
MGNFMNSEIIGRQTDVPWAIIFARIDNLPRHPAQIYEAIAYFFIFITLVTIYKTSKKLKSGFLLGLFFTSVFTARFLIEFIKQRQASYESEFFLNTGQMLSVPFLIIGIGLIIYSIKKK